MLGVSPKSIYSTFREECSYLAELDVHFSILPVGENLDIAARARPQRGTNGRQQRKTSVREGRKNIVTSLGLSQITNTKVENDFVPGISGGER